MIIRLFTAADRINLWIPSVDHDVILPLFFSEHFPPAAVRFICLYQHTLKQRCLSQATIVLLKLAANIHRSECWRFRAESAEKDTLVLDLLSFLVCFVVIL